MPKVIPPKPSSLSTGVALVGEALGRNEASEGFYFVGEAGQLLDRCFSAAGFRQRLAVSE